MSAKRFLSHISLPLLCVARGQAGYRATGLLLLYGGSDRQMPGSCRRTRGMGARCVGHRSVDIGLTEETAVLAGASAVPA